MIELFPPVLRHYDNDAFMECDIIIGSIKERIYYSTPIEFEKYLTYERADSFLLAILQYAMKRGRT